MSITAHRAVVDADEARRPGPVQAAYEDGTIDLLGALQHAVDRARAARRAPLPSQEAADQHEQDVLDDQARHELRLVDEDGGL